MVGSSGLSPRLMEATVEIGPGYCWGFLKPAADLLGTVLVRLKQVNRTDPTCTARLLSVEHLRQDPCRN